MEEQYENDVKGKRPGVIESIADAERRLAKQIDVSSDQTDKRIAATEKRIDDIKWFIGGMATLFTVGFSVLTLILSWNYSNERASLREFQRDLKVDLGKAEPTPELIIQTIEGEDINGKRVNAEVSDDDENKGKFLLVIPHIKRNKGYGSSGPLFMKIYTKKPLALDNRSTDERTFEFEVYFEPKNFSPAELPGQYAVEHYTRFSLRDGIRPPPGEHVVMWKLFYGKGKVTQSTCTIVIPRAG